MKAFRVRVNRTYVQGSEWLYVTYSDGLSPDQSRGRLMNSPQQVKACLRKWSQFGESIVEVASVVEEGAMSATTFKEDF